MLVLANVFQQLRTLHLLYKLLYMKRKKIFITEGDINPTKKMFRAQLLQPLNSEETQKRKINVHFCRLWSFFIRKIYKLNWYWFSIMKGAGACQQYESDIITIVPKKNSGIFCMQNLVWEAFHCQCLFYGHLTYDNKFLYPLNRPNTLSDL